MTKRALGCQFSAWATNQVGAMMLLNKKVGAMMAIKHQFF